MIIKKKFDQLSSSWTEDVKFNEVFLKSQQTYFHDILKHRGYVFLRDIYEALGIEISRESCIYGWTKVRNNIEFDFSQIGTTADFELIFKCHPIINYLKIDKGIC